MSSLSAKTFKSIKSGNWGDTLTWENNILPDLSDSVIIEHYVFLDLDIHIEPTGYLFIDSSGTLCGEHSITTTCGSLFYNYGNVKVYTIDIKDGGNFGFVHAMQR